MIKPEFIVRFAAVATGARSIAICDVCAEAVGVPSLTVQVAVRSGWLPLEVSVPVSW